MVALDFLIIDVSSTIGLICFISRNSNPPFPATQADITNIFDLAFETTVIVSTVYYTMPLVREKNRLAIQGGGGIVETILRDGAATLPHPVRRTSVALILFIRSSVLRVSYAVLTIDSDSTTNAS
jgi:hypothetical protein